MKKHQSLLALALSALLPITAVRAQSSVPIPTPIAEIADPGRPASPPPVTDPAPVVIETASPRPAGAIMMNFQGASLGDVLNYLSEAAGFVIVQEAQVTGTVSVVSRQAITPDEAVDLLNAVLLEKGFLAIRNGRILKIVSRAGAAKRDLPVVSGSDPALIPRKDEMVTQILPVRYGEAAKLVENIRPLLAPDATISANEGSNAILLTDTQTNVRRMAQIIRALDTSVSGISTIKVFPLEFADSKQVATMISQLYASGTAQASGGNQGGGRGRGGFGPGGGGGGGGQAAAAQSEARQAASRVVAVADEQSNSVIVSASDDVMVGVADIITRIDTNITDVSENRIFRLQHADSVELAQIITNLYAETETQGTQNRGQGRQGGGPGGPGGPGGQGAVAAGQQSQRALRQSRVVAVGDPRTNSLIVTAARESMAQIAETVGRLDATDAKKQRVFVHSLEHADADAVAAVLRGMLGQGGSTQTDVSRLSERTSTGAAIDASQATTSGRAGNR